MKRFLIFSAIGVVLIVVLVAIVGVIRFNRTKSYSPEEVVNFQQGELKISVFYNRPYKKGREIFGGLVPYGKVWRTGANEATIFETNKPLIFEGKKLIPGKYSVWTIPDSTAWIIILNQETGQWGIDSNGEANRKADLDVISVAAHSTIQDREFEQFTIRFDKFDDETTLVFMWDKTIVVVPFLYEGQ
jgi:hypothetical protein